MAGYPCPPAPLKSSPRARCGGSLKLWRPSRARSGGGSLKLWRVKGGSDLYRGSDLYCGGKGAELGCSTGLLGAMGLMLEYRGLWLE
eukprot:3600592-Rhodomonas_salina.2